MTTIAHRLVLLCLTFGLTACAPPPVEAPRALAFQDAAPSAPRAESKVAKAVSGLRPRALGRALAFAELAPAAPIGPLESALYDPTPSPGLRSAGLRQLAAQHMADGRPEAAVGAARAARELAVEAYGPNHVESLGALIDLSDALAAAGRPIEAKTALIVARGDAVRLFGPDHPLSAAATVRLDVRRLMAPVSPLLRSLSGQVNRRS